MNDQEEIRKRKKQIAEELVRRGLSKQEVEHVLGTERYKELKAEDVEKCLWEIILYKVAKELLITKYEYIMVRVLEDFNDFLERLEGFLKEHD